MKVNVERLIKLKISELMFLSTRTMPLLVLSNSSFIIKIYLSNHFHKSTDKPIGIGIN